MAYRVFRILRTAHRSYGLVVFWAFVLMFIAAFSLVFVFPPGALVLVFLGLFSLGLAAGFGFLLGAASRHLARGLVRSGVCPGCACSGASFAAESGAWRCAACGGVFLHSGTETTELPHYS